MADVPATVIIACAGSVGFLVAAFFLVGGHRELAWRRAQRRNRRRGGYLL